MSLSVNLRHLLAHSIRLQGEVPIAELDIDTRDEMIEVGGPLVHDLEVEKMEEGLLIQGSLRLPLRCRCVRCLKEFERELELENWTSHVPLQGEEAAPIVNDCVDLTPFAREDILLEFPQHPLCNPGCPGLPSTASGKIPPRTPATEAEASTAWAELNKLKL